MNSVVHYGSNIIAPAIAGFLYPIIGLGGILPIDLATFVVAIVTLVWIRIPQVRRAEKAEAVGANGIRPGKLNVFWSEITFGIRYIWRSNSFAYISINYGFVLVCSRSRWCDRRSDDTRPFG